MNSERFSAGGKGIDLVLSIRHRKNCFIFKA